MQESLFQEVSQAADILKETVLLDYLQNLNGRGACHGMALESVTVDEDPSGESVEDMLTAEHGADRLRTSRKTFADDLDVWDNIVVLPSVQCASATHAAHDLVANEESAVSSADFLHFFQVARRRGRTAKSLLNSYWTAYCILHTEYARRRLLRPLANGHRA